MQPSVLFLCLYPAVYGGNFIPSLMALEQKLSQKGMHCVYCFPREAEGRDWFHTLQQMGKEVITIDFSQPFGKLNRAIREICKTYHVKILYTHFMDDLVTGLFSWLNPKISVFIHIHSDFTGGKAPSALRRIKRFLGYRVLLGRVKFISVSQDLVSLSPRKITWVPNALVTHRLPCPHTSREEMRAALGIAPEETLIELYGWEPEIKGVDVAVHAVRKLVEEQGIPVRLAIVCGDSMVPEKMRLWIAERTTCSGNEDYLVYWTPREDVFAFHEAADLLVSASRSEGFSYSLLEMLSLGKGCVISDIPGTRWAAAFENVSSFVSQDPEDCAAKLKTAILLHRQPNPQVAQAVRDQFSIEAWTDTVSRLLME